MPVLTGRHATSPPGTSRPSGCEVAWHRFGPFVFDPGSPRLHAGNRVVPLREKTLRLLEYLVDRAGAVVSQDELRAALWPGLHLSPVVLSVCISELRRALRDTARPPRFIQTVRGRGYRFIAELEAARDGTIEAVSSRDDESQSLFVGREDELAELQRRFARAAAGERQVVLLVGDAGMGKTSLVRAFRARVQTPRRVWVAFGQCAQQHGPSEPFLPFLQALRDLAQGNEGVPLVSLLRQHAPSWLLHLPGLVAPTERDVVRGSAAPGSGGRMLREMITGVEALAGEMPLLLVLEDLHWADASTVDLLGAIARRQGAARLMILATFRPVEILLSDHPLRSLRLDLRASRCAAEIGLEPLSEAAVDAYLQRRMASPPSAALVRGLHRHSAGNPLFLEHLTDDLCERHLLGGGGGAGTRPTAAVYRALRDLPSGLREMIEQVFRRIPAGDLLLLEAASSLGLEFSAAAVAALLEREAMEVEDDCARLARSGQTLRPSGASEWRDGTVSGRYRFAHPLYREVLYEALPLSRRRLFHLRAGERLETAYGASRDEIAGELAVHFEEAGDATRALRYRELAAERALGRSAFPEAIEHLHAALAALVPQVTSRTRDKRELALLVKLLPLLLNARGFRADEVDRAYARARQLAERLRDAAAIVTVLLGLEWIHRVRGDLEQANLAARQLLTTAERARRAPLLLEGHHTMGSNRFRASDFAGARLHLERVVSLESAEPSLEAHCRSGHDAVSCSLAQLAMLLWLKGYPDQAVMRARQAAARSARVSHPPSAALGYVLATWTHIFRREGERVHELATAAATLAREHGLPLWEAIGRMMQGWALVELGQAGQGLALLHDGFVSYQSTAGDASTVDYHVLLASAFDRVGEVAEGRRTIAVAFDVLERYEQRYFEPELHRLRGELEEDPEQAETSFLRAVAVARTQQARSLELRAAMSLARLRRRAKRGDALELVEAAYRHFSEGFDSIDLREAAALLRRSRAVGPGLRSRTRRA